MLQEFGGCSTAHVEQLECARLLEEQEARIDATTQFRAGRVPLRRRNCTSHGRRFEALSAALETHMCEQRSSRTETACRPQRSASTLILWRTTG